ncbi:hypothetical protein HSB1_06640 [Halogranum salarium B-1]|uniref:DICT domain-containing protein n=2 Tax=Halogranum rubrum TaxID=553466 RepID=J3A7M4_9EURY|nr:hypothetical protein HSB1_06640 [Halogranum salarium B-1]
MALAPISVIWTDVSGHTMSLKELIHEMEDRRKTITVFAHEPQFGVGSYFGARHVTVEYERLPTADTDEFVTVSAGDDFLGSVALSSLRALDEPRIHEPGSDELVSADLRYLFSLLDDTIFSSFDRRQMVATSREIEDRAIRVGRGTLYAGFQRLSALRDQLETYHDIDRAPELDIHVYGQPDWEPPASSGIAVHRLLDDEVRDCWFVVFDGGGDDLSKCALVAEERFPGQFYGFWTYDPALVDSIVEHVEHAFTHTPDAQVDHHPDNGNETP